MKPPLLAIGIAISSSLVALDAKAATFSGLTVFGDSLVDTGNLFNITDALAAPFGLSGLPPSPPYDQTNSNGPLWIDNVAQALGLALQPSTDLLLNPSSFSSTQGLNFAFSGALSSDVHILDDDLPPALASLFPGFQAQIDRFAALSNIAPPDPNNLYVVWVGGNDYSEAFFTPDSLGDLSLADLPNVVTDNIINGLTQLNDLGAKEFLVVNLPSLGAAPFADFLDADFPRRNIPQTLDLLSFGHNRLLSEKLNVFSQAQPDANVITLDVSSLFDDILADPNSFGLTNVTDPCLINFQPVFQFDGVCENPDEYLWWDDVHPTAAVYEIVSDFALATLNHGVSNTSLTYQSTYPSLSGDTALVTWNSETITWNGETTVAADVPEPGSALLTMASMMAAMAQIKRKRMA
ncbi:MAG: SGNH/GDSL hydrolase family protein, partial [Leptolyngbyaceae cyanobacterium MAG.088]|nr:SGNH/GDSL hydrolase family protein [Leptolyngbyaceae cyanobacterium MAG.088]